MVRYGKIVSPNEGRGNVHTVWYSSTWNSIPSHPSLQSNLMQFDPINDIGHTVHAVGIYLATWPAMYVCVDVVGTARSGKSFSISVSRFSGTIIHAFQTPPTGDCRFISGLWNWNRTLVQTGPERGVSWR